MLGIIISQAKSTFRVLGSRSRSLRLFLEKLCYGSCPHLSVDFKQNSHKLLNSNISRKFDFQDAAIKVKVVVAISEENKNFVIALVLTFINGF